VRSADERIDGRIMMMNSVKRGLGAAVVAVMCLGTAGSVQAAGADAKQAAFTPATCTTRGTGSVGFNKSGTRVTLNAGVSGVAAGSPWHVVVTDTVAGVVARAAVPVTASAWSSLINYTTRKGIRVIVVKMTSDNGANTCTAKLTYRA
jgi:hypothetical protein